MTTVLNLRMTKNKSCASFFGAIFFFFFYIKLYDSVRYVRFSGQLIMKIILENRSEGLMKEVFLQSLVFKSFLLKFLGITY